MHADFLPILEKFLHIFTKIGSILLARRVDFAGMREKAVRIFWVASPSAECLPALFLFLTVPLSLSCSFHRLMNSPPAACFPDFRR
jgi:hypothetical protein